MSRIKDALSRARHRSLTVEKLGLTTYRREMPTVLNYKRIYEFRHQGTHQEKRQAVWNVISKFIHVRLGLPKKVLDPAAGLCEFISASPAEERWAIDSVEFPEALRSSGIKFVLSDAMEADLPANHFDGVFVSNFLEHLPSPEAVAVFLLKMKNCMASGGRIAILGPNFKFCMKEYFECADHTLILTEVSVAEHLYAAGFEIETNLPRFIPYSFRSRLPASPGFVKLYLRLPLLWRFLGKQFLVIARKP